MTRRNRSSVFLSKLRPQLAGERDYWRIRIEIWLYILGQKRVQFNGKKGHSSTRIETKGYTPMVSGQKRTLADFLILYDIRWLPYALFWPETLGVYPFLAMAHSNIYIEVGWVGVEFKAGTFLLVLYHLSLTLMICYYRSPFHFLCFCSNCSRLLVARVSSMIHR